MSLDLSSFKKAIQQLEDSLDICENKSARGFDSRIEKQLKAGAIQAFEFTYELSWKLIKRYLETTEPSPDFDDITYRKRRGITSHTYDENKAEDIYQNIPEFLTEVKYLFKQLEQRGLKDSDLPYKVDLIDLNSASQAFRAAIDNELTEILF